MFPFLDLHFAKIPLYGLSMVVGGLVGSVLVFFLCKKFKKNFLDFIIISVLMLAFGFVGAKILYLFVTYPIKSIPRVVFEMLFNRNRDELGGGFVFYGGIIGAIGGYFFGVKIAQCKVNDFNEIYTFVLPFVHAFGRIGCFCAGCCYGIRYDGPLAVYYHDPISTVEPNVGIFPVQLVESFLLLIFSISMLTLYVNHKKVSVLYYAGFYAVLRFVLEYFRGDVERGRLYLFSTSQWISIGLLVATVVCLVIFHIRTERVNS